MKILYRGVPEVVYPWTEKTWSCPVCGSIIQFEEQDEPAIKYKANDNKETIDAVCPVCLESRTFTPVDSGDVVEAQ